jgi:hypothetical protein
MKKLLAHFQIFPSFLNIIHQFGRQTSEPGPSSGYFYSQSCKSASGRLFEVNPTNYETYTHHLDIELCYIVSTAEKNGRDDVEDLYSMRKFGIYHRKNHQDESNTIIVINPTISFQQFFKSAREISPCGWMSLHKTVLSHCSFSWRQYVNYLEQDLARLVSSCINACTL